MGWQQLRGCRLLASWQPPEICSVRRVSSSRVSLRTTRKKGEQARQRTATLSESILVEKQLPMTAVTDAKQGVTTQKPEYLECIHTPYCRPRETQALDKSQECGPDSGLQPLVPRLGVRCRPRPVRRPPISAFFGFWDCREA